MKEDFLYYLWQQQAFDRTNLRTLEGEPLTILATGTRNADAGPDFAAARLRIGTVEWNGAVEMHLRASDWARHRHHDDPAYDQVILHVVWEADAEVRRRDGSVVPTLALRARVSERLVMAYHGLIGAATPVPCAAQVAAVPGVLRTLMLERALLERAEAKADRVAALLASTGSDWEATTWHALLAGFGFRTNQEPMTRLARALPWDVARRYRTQLPELESLLLGQAGLLPDPTIGEEPYLTDLRTHWLHLRHKHTLPPALRASDWKFARMRPANFPTVRLAQVAAVLAHHDHLLAGLRAAAASPRLLAQFFAAPVSAFWERHYHFDSPPAPKPLKLGADSAHRLVMNVAVPVLVAYARFHHRLGDVEEALALLDRLPAEHNHLLAPYEGLGFRNQSAADAQGLLGLHHLYCAPRACLRCAIGANILKRGAQAAAPTTA